VHSPNAGDHSLSRAASTVDRDHGGKSCPPQSWNRIDAEGSVLPHTGTHTRLCEFHYDSGDAIAAKFQVRETLADGHRFVMGIHCIAAKQTR
jgi:hypothetical protein